MDPSCCGTKLRNLLDGSRALLFLNWLKVEMVENLGIEFCLLRAGEVCNERENIKMKSVIKILLDFIPKQELGELVFQIYVL